jgi:hypothetical protein
MGEAAAIRIVLSIPHTTNLLLLTFNAPSHVRIYVLACFLLSSVHLTLV